LIFNKNKLLHHYIERVKKSQYLRVGKLGTPDLVLQRVDIVVPCSGEVRFFQHGILELASLQVRASEGRLCEVGVNEIRFPDRAFGEFRPTHFQIAEVAQFDQAALERPFDQQGLDSGKSGADNLTVIEGDLLKAAILDLDIRQVRIRKDAIDERRSGKLAIAEIALPKGTVREFPVLQILPRTNDFIENLIIENAIA
jgi:hypothetical protein